MAKCALCERSGFLLSIDQNELCEVCANLLDQNYEILNSFRKQLSFCRQSRDFLGFILSKFQTAKKISELFSNGEWQLRWESLIKTTLNDYITKLIKNGYLQAASPIEILEKEFSLYELKKLLINTGQRPLGNKFELAGQVLHHLPNILHRYHNYEYYVCTKDGHALAENYQINQRNWSYETAKTIYFLISRHEFLLALRIMVNHAVSQVEAPENTVDWNQYLFLLNKVYERDLSIYSMTKEDEALSKDFTAYSMIYRDQDFDDAIIRPDISLHKNFYKSVTDSISFCQASYEIHQIQSVKKFVRHIQVNTVDDDFVCPACKAAAEQKYSVNLLPDIPIKDCTSEVGCRCSIEASM